MANAQKLLSDYQVELDENEIDLIEQKDAVLSLIDSDHKSQDTRKYIKAVRQSEVKLNSTLRSLHELKRSAQFTEAAEKLCARCKEQELYIRDMTNRLEADLGQRQREEDAGKTDIVKHATFLVAIPVGFIAGVNNGFGKGHIDAYEAGSAGLVVSVAVLSRKRLGKSFKQVAESVCQTAKEICAMPRQIMNSMAVYYVKETIKEKGVATAKMFKNCAKRLNDKTSKLAPKVRQTITRLLDHGNPKL